MKTTFVSSSGLYDALRSSVLRLQSNLVNAQKEAVTGRHADMGLALGYQAGSTVTLRQEAARLTAITDSNAMVGSRMDAAQASLKSMVDDGNNYVKSLISSPSPTVLKAIAKNGVSGLINGLNASSGDQYLFAGVNTDVAPIKGPIDAGTGVPTAAKESIETAFEDFFGFPVSDSAKVATIDADKLKTFLTTDFKDLFIDHDNVNWTADWCDATVQTVQSRISTNETIQTSISAMSDPSLDPDPSVAEPTHKGFQRMAEAYAMVSALPIENFNTKAYTALVKVATGVAGQAALQVSNQQSVLGNSQERVTSSNSRMAIQQDIMNKSINKMETVDPYEAATKATELMNQLNTAYALTAKIQNLSILNYIS